LARPEINKKPDTLTLTDPLQALRNLPAFFKLVWQTNPWMTTASFSMRIIRSAMPVALLYVGKLIIDSVVLLSKTHNTDTYHLWQLVGLEFALAIFTDGLSRAITLMDSLLGDRFGNYTSVRIMSHAATLDLDQFEDSVF
jgi:ATP-binding cassette subfamily B protein